MLLFTALIAVVFPLLFLVILKMPAKKGMALSYVILFLGAYFIWGMELKVLAASSLQGIHKALTILLILLGAMVLLNMLKNTGAITRLNKGFKALSEDMRILAIILAFLFGALLEGVSGFGAPVAVVGALMVALEFQPLTAAILVLIANSTPVPFGAVGTPIFVGLSNVSGLSTQDYGSIATLITKLDIFLGTFMPLLLVVVLVLSFGKKNKIKSILEMAPWSILIGLVYTLSAYLYAELVGPEFVSILAPITGLFAATMTCKMKFLIPKHIWIEALDEEAKVEIESSESDMSLFRAWVPYILVVLVLLTTRIFPVIKNFTTSAIDLSWKNIMGFEQISGKWPLLYSPGTVLILIAFLTIFLQKSNYNSFKRACLTSFGQVKNTTLILFPTLALVQIFSNSWINGLGYASMPQYIATTMSSSFAESWIFIAPFIGMLGTFISGSGTVSNLTFGAIQHDVANIINLNPTLILAEQTLGAGVGHIICVNVVVAACTVVGLSGKEGIVIRKVFVPSVLYSLGIGVVAFAFS
ncbi:MULTISPECIES: L-lactate permease [Psychrilyobacter]|uniref:L-lactate permease n=1 Tax=Psychrilyobacter piezotolerans TaxID=2293438 RepID=A0ABX9KEI3_9FUSO|nr:MULTISPECIES: L-lactate permease [Psychrilyobacter]MCS5421310.1 L-lactate permease [Psychrilyobacter sp. S5]NDI78332.1 L-lactate permease [Psychrilyobacter piezotolerans]RDE59679.1 L-lactate permease [Psychrilyobacter sp. S5]REI40055.1 L-lactate permease [Psychrilyobacter piezotolerans]